MYIGQKGENQIELVVEGYQHPDVSQNYFEANWLMIGLSAAVRRVLVQTARDNII